MTLAPGAQRPDGSPAADRPDVPAGGQQEGRPAAGTSGGPAAGLWPGWASVQLEAAVRLADGVGDAAWLTRTLYREWFNPTVFGVERFTRRAAVGRYRAAHAGSERRTLTDGVWTIARHDVIGADGWWRTWGERWTPPRTRRGSVRILMTPAPSAVAELVTLVTAALLDSTLPWSLSCAQRPGRLRRVAPVVLDLPHAEAIPAGLLDAAAPLFRPFAPPLCLPLRPGVALAHYADNGMSFGEHRCHLISTALRRTPAGQDPLGEIARVFTAHGIDPAAPYRTV